MNLGCSNLRRRLVNWQRTASLVMLLEGRWLGGPRGCVLRLLWLPVLVLRHYLACWNEILSFITENKCKFNFFFTEIVVQVHSRHKRSEAGILIIYCNAWLFDEIILWITLVRWPSRNSQNDENLLGKEFSLLHWPFCFATVPRLLSVYVSRRIER